MNIIKLRINVLAYNEACFIESCLDSINNALLGSDDIQAEVNIICNGCVDNTYYIAQAYCRNKTMWQVFNISLGDKANAWNFAIKQGSDENKLTVFIDGDCSLRLNSIVGFIKSYQKHSNSYVIAGIPNTKGRTTKNTIDKTLRGEALSGNLYALTPNFLQKIHEERFKLPIGLIGDDSLLAWVASHDFKLSNGIKKGYLIGCEDAKFDYHRLNPTSINNIYLYVRRLTRYSLRHLQQYAIREHLNKHDTFASIPSSITSLYSNVKFNHIRIKSFNGVFDLINFLKIKKESHHLSIKDA